MAEESTPGEGGPEEEGEAEAGWAAIPGTVKAAAALVTAVTGLLVALNQMGWLGGGADAPGSVAPVDVAATGPGAPGSGGRYGVALPSGSTATLRSNRGEGRYDVLAATAEPRGADRVTLKVSVRLTGAGPLDLAFSSDYFRLLVDGVPREPLNWLNEAVDARSAKEADLLFEVPTAAAELVLEIDNGEDRASLPLVVERAS